VPWAGSDQVSTRKRHRPRRILCWGGGFALLAVAYYGFSLWQVRRAAGYDQAAPAQAIMVLGSAQYAGVPSPDLAARLDHAYALWKRKLAPVMVVTGGREPGDHYTESGVSAGDLVGRGVPEGDIIRQVGGRNTWQSMGAAADFLKARGITRVLLVSDPFHDKRLLMMASQLGLDGRVSPTRTSPIRGSAVWRYELKEAAEVAVGRVIGYRALDWLDVRLGLSA
jgi:uncharacterized SAM-binding protein YcdF (DUF218 family)